MSPLLPTLCPSTAGSLLSPFVQTAAVVLQLEGCRAVTAGKGWVVIGHSRPGGEGALGSAGPGGWAAGSGSFAPHVPLPGVAPALNRRLPWSPSRWPCRFPLPVVPQRGRWSPGPLCSLIWPRSTHKHCPRAVDGQPGPRWAGRGLCVDPCPYPWC